MYLLYLIIYGAVLSRVDGHPEQKRVVECPTSSENGLINQTILNPDERVITFEKIRENYKKMEYKVKSSISIRSFEIRKELADGAIKRFKNVTLFNMADAQAMGQKPMTFVRQVLALVTYPDLMNPSLGIMPSDAIAKAKRILEKCDSSTVGMRWSYGDSEGMDLIRKDVAGFISRRDDGIVSNYEDIILTEGVSDGIMIIMKLLQNEGMDTGIMVPHPLYSFYSSVIEKYAVRRINYYLNERKDWALEISELERAHEEALCSCNCRPRAILIINPSNPTGRILQRSQIESIVKFAYRKGLIILADEIFQENLHVKDAKFLSFKKVLMEMEAPFNKKELISFHSISKGYISEGGLRGGYFEFINSDSRLNNTIFQLLAVKQCPNLVGQVALDCMVAPPKVGDASYELFAMEKNNILQDMREIGYKLSQELNKLEGFQCLNMEGGPLAFTKITLPLKAIQAAEAIGRKPDEFYALELLEWTGIVVAIGSDFALPPEKTYLRITIPNSMEQLEELLKSLQAFHTEFMRKYS